MRLAGALAWLVAVADGYVLSAGARRDRRLRSAGTPRKLRSDLAARSSAGATLTARIARLVAGLAARAISRTSSSSTEPKTDGSSRRARASGCARAERLPHRSTRSQSPRRPRARATRRAAPGVAGSRRSRSSSGRRTEQEVDQTRGTTADVGAPAQWNAGSHGARECGSRCSTPAPMQRIRTSTTTTSGAGRRLPTRAKIVDAAELPRRGRCVPACGCGRRERPRDARRGHRGRDRRGHAARGRQRQLRGDRARTPSSPSARS